MSSRVWLFIGLGLLLLLLLQFFSNGMPATNEVSLTQFAETINSGQISRVIVRAETELRAEASDGTIVAVARKERNSDIYETLRNVGVTEDRINSLDIAIQSGENTATLLFNLIPFLLPTLLLGFLVWRMLRTARMGQDQAMSFGRSRARVSRDMERPTVTFSDVAGADEAKQELQEVVEFLKEPDKFIQLGARIPKGVLMVGPPGTGKTLMARAIAGEAGVPFFSISGSEFVEMFVGVGASRVRDLFDRAKKEAPAIVFVDEIDAVGRQRGAGLGGGNDEREQTLNQILTEMDGFETDTNVIIIAATNRPDVLDPALLRPGRFDRKVILDRPDVKGREAIFKVHTKGKPLASDVDIAALGKLTPGFAGADIENLVNEAAILAARRNKKTIGMREFQEALERIIAGPERRSRVIQPKEREVVAYHEAGHAVVMYHLIESDPVHKITIIPRGQAGGYTMSLPDEDTMLISREKFEEQIVGLLGGRAAEEIIFNRITTGASNDLERATQIARAMITRYGMSEKLGLRTFGEQTGNIFLGRDLMEQRNYSEEAAVQIDQEVRRILDHAYLRAKTILQENRAKLQLLSETLLEKETVDRDEFEAMMSESTQTADLDTEAVIA
ncbi:MAG: ATP-dependent zinc metalloprotease FtsH [Anaerolineae bacterium]|nr:ATP-dependent zinc metalloprotease FtsH [Anaerolineae bacterium]